MSQNRNGWWSYVKYMARKYPNRIGRELQGTEDAEQAAVEAALRAIAERADGDARVQLVKMVFFDKTHTLAGAALALHCSERTARRWHTDFLREVGRKFGL